MNYILLNVFLVILFVYYLKKMKRGFHMLQLESYKNERYTGWIRKNKNEIKILKQLVSKMMLTIWQKISNLMECTQTSMFI